MDRQVFISHSSRDKDIAAAIYDQFEKAGMRCWMAWRDALPGRDYALSIIEAIDDSRLMLVVLSKDASKSDHVINEINRAVDQHVPILPVKVDDTALSRTLDYYLGKTHRFDASRPPLQAHLDVTPERDAAAKPRVPLDGQGMQSFVPDVLRWARYCWEIRPSVRPAIPGRFQGTHLLEGRRYQRVTTRPSSRLALS